MSLVAACTNLRTVMGGLSGITRVYESAPDSINQFPALLVYPYTGEIHILSNGVDKSLHTLAMDIVQGAQSLTDNVLLAETWPDGVRALLVANPTLSGAVTTVVSPVQYQARAMRYGNNVYFGVRFLIQVKVTSSS